MAAICEDTNRAGTLRAGVARREYTVDSATLLLSTMTKKGLTATMTGDKMRISNPSNDVVLVGVRDAGSQLFLLQQATAAAPSDMHDMHQAMRFNSALLAKSYQAGDGSELDLLWKLHLRHGHRNFADLARQYKLSIPKQTPACTSCVMGKAHLQPKLSNGFERATRKAEVARLFACHCCNPVDNLAKGGHSGTMGPIWCQTR